MFGYACNETKALMPAPIFYSHHILRSLAEARHDLLIALNSLQLTIEGECR